MAPFQINQLPLFAALPPEEMSKLDEILHPCEFAEDAILFREGEAGDRFSIILEGQVAVIKAMGTLDERILAILGPGEFIGEMSLLYRDRMRSASARAHTRVLLLDMTQDDFKALLMRQPIMAFRIMQEMSIRLRNSENATIRDLQEKNHELAEAYIELQAAQMQIIEKEKMEHELAVARKIQEGILPKEMPLMPGWQVAAYWQPARAVSGDFYDFVSFSDGRQGLVIGDVTGKGVPAALVMATTRSVLHAVVKQKETPSEILYELNNLLCADMPSGMFVTCQVAVLDPASGQLRFANAGHELPYLCNAAEANELRATGMPLGLMPDMNYEEKGATLVPGDSLLMYSDGLVEAHNPQREMFGFPRLRALLQQQSWERGGPGLIQFLLAQLAQFTTAAVEQEDDVTFVTLERLG